mgnify:CR=1 FL=1
MNKLPLTKDKCFYVIPAVDIKDGCCVRLQQGKDEAVTLYDKDPVSVARKWAGAGACWLHVVDLDGAFKGQPVNENIIKQIVKTVPSNIEVGGGIRSNSDIEEMINIGVKRVIVGTQATEDLNQLAKMTKKYNEYLAVGIDALNGMVCIHGWKTVTNINAIELAKKVAGIGVRTIIYTDITRDGMLGGINLEAIASMCESVSCEIIASGGVKSNTDVINLYKLPYKNLRGVIIGKALYERKVDINELLAIV